MFLETKRKIKLYTNLTLKQSMKYLVYKNNQKHENYNESWVSDQLTNRTVSLPDFCPQ